MKTRSLITSLLLMAVAAGYANGGQSGMQTLKGAFENDFLMGAAISRRSFTGSEQPRNDLVVQQFNSISSCNMLKWGPFNPRPGVYDHDLADAYVEFGSSNNMYVVGHVLFWHNQTPKWVFEDDSGNQLARDALLARMRERVKHVAKRYGSRIDAWDVVNESIMENGKLRDSMWTKIIGPDFIEQAFRIADEELPADVELLYNDYSMTGKGKRDGVIRMIQDLKKKGIRIDGVGMQGHWSIGGPSLDQIEESIVAFAKTGVDVHITELDIDVLPRAKGMHGADVAKRLEQDPKMDPYVDALPDEMQQRLAKRYADIFRVFVKHSDKVKRVTFWGVADSDSWLNNWPIKGRTSYPLLFDRDGNPKPAFHSVIQIKSKEKEK